MALTNTEFANAMKIFYLGPLNEQTFKSTVLLDRLQKDSEPVDGKYAYVPLITAMNRGVGSRKDTATVGPTLPTAGRQSYDKATFPMCYHYGRGSVSGPVMRASKTKAGAFAQAMDIEMKGLSKSLPADLNRQLWSYGHGRAATLASNSAAKVTIECSSRAIFSLRVGDWVHAQHLASWATPQPANGTTISAIYLDTTSAGAASDTIHKVVLADALTKVTYSADAIYYGKKTSMAAADSSWAQEMYGIPAAIDDGNLAADEGLGATTVAGNAAEFVTASLNYGGIARTNAFWRANVLQGSTAGTLRALSVPLLEEGFLTAVSKGGCSESDLEIYTDPGLWATWGLLHIGDRIFNDFKETIEGGWIALKFNNRPVLYDIAAPRHNIWFLDMSALLFLTQTGYEFMDDDGSILSRVADTDAYEFTLYRDCQLGAKRCNSSVRLSDVKPSLYITQTAA